MYTYSYIILFSRIVILIGASEEVKRKPIFGNYLLRARGNAVRNSTPPNGLKNELKAGRAFDVAGAAQRRFCTGKTKINKSASWKVHVARVGAARSTHVKSRVKTAVLLPRPSPLRRVNRGKCGSNVLYSIGTRPYTE